MSNTKIFNDKKESAKSAYLMGEFSKILRKTTDDLENSVGLFDAIGEKNETFKKFEDAFSKSPIETFIKMNDMSQGQIFDFVLFNFINIFSQYKDKLNFVHIGDRGNRNLIFFISTKDEEIKTELSDTEFEYATSDLSEYLDINFCFLDSDMEEDLTYTKKLNLDDQTLR